MAEINVEELKTAAPIVEYVKKYYNDKIIIVEESNTVAKANCIWHQDKESPSLSFFKNSNTYKCFGCGKYGDLIVLVQELEKVGFQDACKIIGDNVGYEIILTPPNPYHEAYKDAMDNHTRRYWYNLKNDYNAQCYLQKRGITQQTINEFRIGLTDTQEYLFRKETGGIGYRISFPILEPKNKNAKCIGMGYRTILDEKPKYINDANQDGTGNKDQLLSGVFIKGNCLYGYTQAYDFIKRAKYAILVEGYMDVISLHQSNIKNVVGVMGTSITSAQVQLLSKITKNVMLIMDSDNAGINSMQKILPELYKAGITVKVCILDKGEDPANICLNNNFDIRIISEIIRRNTIDSMSFIFNNIIKDYESVIVQKRREVLKNMQPIIDSLSGIDRTVYMDMLLKRLDMKGV
jgi:DNA primase